MNSLEDHRKLDWVVFVERLLVATRIAIAIIKVIKGSFGWPRGTLFPLCPSLAVGIYLWLVDSIVALARHVTFASSFALRNRFEIPSELPS